MGECKVYFSSRTFGEWEITQDEHGVWAKDADQHGVQVRLQAGTVWVYGSPPEGASLPVDLVEAMKIAAKELARVR